MFCLKYIKTFKKNISADKFIVKIGGFHLKTKVCTFVSPLLQWYKYFNFQVFERTYEYNE